MSRHVSSVLTQRLHPDAMQRRVCEPCKGLDVSPHNPEFVISWWTATGCHSTHRRLYTCRRALGDATAALLTAT